MYLLHLLRHKPFAENATETLGSLLTSVLAMECRNHLARQLHLSLHRMEWVQFGKLRPRRFAGHQLWHWKVNAPLQFLNLLWGAVGKKFVVRPHQFVRDGHHLAEHFAGRLGDTDVVTETLGHFALAIEANEDRHSKRHLPSQAVLPLDVTSHQ